MYSTTDNPEPVHRAKGGLQGSSGSGGSATEKMQQTGQNVTGTIGEKMGQAKEKMGMNK
jgi:hypothetical protein